jgi:hypothetical protein
LIAQGPPDAEAAPSPGAFTNPAYILLCLAAGVVGYLIAFSSGQLFREGLFQFMTSFSLPWYAIAGAEAAEKANLPVLGVLALAVIGPWGSHQATPDHSGYVTLVIGAIASATPTRSSVPDARWASCN